MVQGSRSLVNASRCKYINAFDAFRKVISADGPKGLGSLVLCLQANNENGNNSVIKPDSKTIMAFQGVSAAIAGRGSVSTLITMPLDTIKTRLQVLDGEDSNSSSNNRKCSPTIRQTVRNLVREGGWMACYRGLGPRCPSMSMSATTTITT
ncbi:Mitochondrial substrate/solute carrier [Arabidopsis thaliana x Arabidopsis arenosa]|uniref:Mitochondrial substrate/solute carrier n=1 Tax=Arabidopsis thaliana x Arabidopsis arenosa TaxID=1240361 RepID=A0A8T2C1B0_9BRAS|nr:Mitochondrial substrate/solute carrier [Arabidopsis thaliana x Arabidopsis arenosa]